MRARRALACAPLLLAACAAAPEPPPAGPTAAEARAFTDEAERELLGLWIDAQRAAWVKSTYLTEDTERLEAQANEAVMAATGRLAREAVRFEGLALPDDVRRKLALLRLGQSLPAPSDPALRAELARIASGLEASYGRARVCRGGRCLSLEEVEEILAESRDPDELLALWSGWHAIGPPLRAPYARLVELANRGARELGFADVGELWRSRYDMPASAFEAEAQRLWGQVRPLYEQLHCHARARLRQRYGADLVPETGPIPAHLLGNMWAQSWAHLTDLLLPERARGIDLEGAFARRGIDEREMVRFGERFFTSLGLAPLPASFWERSMFTRPRDREVVCHASAWDVDFAEDVRIKMCIRRTGEDFTTIHHELGHNYYQYYYREQPPLFRDSAHDGFHEGLGDTIALSVTPSYLVRVGLLEREPADALGPLLERALEKVAFLPFGLLVDAWRWEVFAGRVAPQEYDRRWWELRRLYQGVAPPAERPADAFDPGAKYHVPANVPYARYFLAAVLQFQFHRALCRAAGHDGPLHACSVHGSREAGARLARMMELGLSRPWPEALEALTGETRMDAGALLEYFEPVARYLAAANRGRACGW
jgi:peptidyl-dipeptidase A